MAVQRIEQYGDTLKVFLNSKKICSNYDYFYCDLSEIVLVNQFSWYLHCFKNYNRIEAKKGSQHILLHREIALKYLGYYPSCIDHVNMVSFDNIDTNLNAVNKQQNSYNCFIRGYEIIRTSSFNPTIGFNKEHYSPYKAVHSEFKACILQNEIEQVWLREQLKDDYYMFNFLKYRRGSEDILDLERTGQISEEEAIYRHVLRYADNAWYYYRYGLEQYFRENHIPVPDFDLDSQGFMVDKITRKHLCSFD